MTIQRRVLFFLLVASIGLPCCGAATQPSETADAQVSDSEPAAEPVSSGLSGEDARVLSEYKSDDPGVLANLGGRLESERPKLSPQLVDGMLEFRRAAPPAEGPLNMMRGMVFRTASVVVGAPAKPSLERCVAANDDLSSECQAALDELNR
jgi:hypothetical protein